VRFTVQSVLSARPSPPNPLSQVVRMITKPMSPKVLQRNGFLFALRLVVLILPFAAALLVISQTAGSTLDERVQEKIATILAESGAPSVSIAVVEHGQLVYAKAFGLASLAPNRAADARTRYAVGSISKQFTAAAILLIAQQGKLSLDDRVSKYFPDLTRADEITIRELLSHTSGYPNYALRNYMIAEWTKSTTPEAILDDWAKKPLDFDPGTRWQYSDTNYVLAGRISEKASGEPLMAFLKSKIFEPLGMYTAGECSLEKTPQDAVGYTRHVLGPVRPALGAGPGWYFAAGELCMTPSDLARWDVAFLHKQILNAESYNEFTHEVHLANGSNTHYALGLRLEALEAGWPGHRYVIPTVNHGGGVSGFLAVNDIYPTRDAAVIVCSNQDGTEIVRSVAEEVSRWVLEPFTQRARQLWRRVPWWHTAQKRS
jgi:D-alanyl-D-alanine carboxypeptidase